MIVASIANANPLSAGANDTQLIDKVYRNNTYRYLHRQMITHTYESGDLGGRISMCECDALMVIVFSHLDVDLSVCGSPGVEQICAFRVLE
jgi:hypothetical protein